MHNPARCFPATPLQLYSSTNPHHAGKRRGLRSVTLNLLFQSCILVLCTKFSSCSSSHFATQSLAWCNHRVPRCLLSGPNNTTVVDYPCTETIPMPPSPPPPLPQFHYLLCCLFYSFSFWKSGYETELITPGSEAGLCGVLNCSHFSLCHDQYLCLNINNFFCLSVQCQQHCKPLKEERSELTPKMLFKSQSRGEVNSQLIFLTSLPSKCCPCPQKRMFPRDSLNSDSTRTEKV